MRYFPLPSHAYGHPSLFQTSFSIFFIDIEAFFYAISKKNTPHFPIFCITVFALRSRRTFFFCSLFFIIYYYVFRSSRSGSFLARGPRRRPSYAPGPSSESRSSDCPQLCGFLSFPEMISSFAQRRFGTRKRTSPLRREKNGSPEGARPCPVFPFVPMLPPDGRRAAHRHPKEKAVLPYGTGAKTAPRRSRTPSIARYVKCKSAASPQGEAALFVLYPMFTCSYLPALRPQRRP